MIDTAYDVVLPSSRTGRAARRTRGSLKFLFPALAALGLIALWDLWVRVGDVSPFILASPRDVGARMIDRWDLFLPEAWTTVQLMLMGFTLAVVGGLLFAILIVAFRPIELTLYPILVGSQVIPKIAIAPVIFIWFGLDTNARLIIVFLLAFFPVVIATVVGMKSLEPAKLYLARSMGAGRLDILFRFRFRQALPEIFGGIKLAATRAVGAAIVAEFITPGEGLGRTIFVSTSELRPDIALAGVAYLVIVGLLFFFIVAGAERLAIPWHQSVRVKAGRN